MSSLREIKDRIASVRSTLKITSAMKLVASSKLRKSQSHIESLRPYEQSFGDVLSALFAHPVASSLTVSGSPGAPVAIVAISSNTSLCGAFNANVIKKALETAREYESVKFFCIGRKIGDAIRKSQYESLGNMDELIAKTGYDKSAEFARELMERFTKGEFSKIILVYNHFQSTATQRPISEDFLPYSYEEKAETEKKDTDPDYIFEPRASEIASKLIPRLLCLKMYAAILDSEASEHAARTVAMQTATDNAEHLLSDLTLEYNKGRQQKITSEILDLVGGSL